MSAGILQQSNATNASYLFQPDRLNAEYDIGDKTIQCGRRGDAFKLWLAWKVCWPNYCNDNGLNVSTRNLHAGA